jgi:hypothetical protein
MQILTESRYKDTKRENPLNKLLVRLKVFLQSYLAKCNLPVAFWSDLWKHDLQYTCSFLKSASALPANVSKLEQLLVKSACLLSVFKEAV